MRYSKKCSRYRKGARELLSQGQRLLQLNVSSVGSATHALNIVLAGGDDDLFTPTVTQYYCLGTAQSYKAKQAKILLNNFTSHSSC